MIGGLLSKNGIRIKFIKNFHLFTRINFFK